ncbi:MAG: PilN domain-containing protein [Deltaproteobacteria bacterium]|nr:PilN domain-containing protein [Deltaproteobacteria bacterium]MCB9488280.1 PilN domain-containing protein [Deltaproteobacteria bacterium]
MIRVNLLPETAGRKTGRKKKAAAAPVGAPSFIKEIPITWILIGLVAILATSVAMAAIQLTLNNKEDQIRDKIVQLDVEIKSLGVEIAKIEEFKKKSAELKSKLEVIDNLKLKQKGPVHLLDQLASAVPPRLWLTEIAENGSSITINGATLDDAQISAFMINLDKSPFFSRVELSTIMAQTSKRGAESGIIKSFALNSAVEYPKDLQ